MTIIIPKNLTSILLYLRGPCPLAHTAQPRLSFGARCLRPAQLQLRRSSWISCSPEYLLICRPETLMHRELERECKKQNTHTKYLDYRYNDCPFPSGHMAVQDCIRG